MTFWGSSKFWLPELTIEEQKSDRFNTNILICDSKNKIIGLKRHKDEYTVTDDRIVIIWVN